MDDKMKLYTLIALGIIIVIIAVAIAVEVHGGHGHHVKTTSTPTITTSWQQYTTQVTRTITTQVPTTTTSVMTITTQTLKQTTMSTSTVLTVNKQTVMTGVVSIPFVIPTSVQPPVIGSYYETITAYGISVPKTTYTLEGVFAFNNSLVFTRAGIDNLTILPISLSGVATKAAIIVGNFSTTVPIDWYNFPVDAFSLFHLGKITCVSSTIVIDYTTYIDGTQITGMYAYYSGTAFVAIHWPHTFTLSGVIFQVNGTYTMTYMPGQYAYSTTSFFLTSSVYTTTIQSLTTIAGQIVTTVPISTTIVTTTTSVTMITTTLVTATISTTSSIITLS